MGKQQREYISILGIFAAVVLAFTGGIAFSTSVLKNINTVSVYRITGKREKIKTIIIFECYIIFAAECRSNCVVLWLG